MTAYVISLLVHAVAPTLPNWLGIAAGTVSALMLTAVFLAYQRWRFAVFDARV